RIEREIERCPHREPAGPLEAAIARKIGPRRGYVGGGGDAQRCGVRKRAGEGRVTLGGRRVGDRAADEIERAVLEDARRLSRPRVPQDLAAGGGEILRDARTGEPTGI